MLETMAYQQRCLRTVIVCSLCIFFPCSCCGAGSRLGCSVPSSVHSVRCSRRVPVRVGFHTVDRDFLRTRGWRGRWVSRDRVCGGGLDYEVLRDASVFRKHWSMRFGMGDTGFKVKLYCAIGLCLYPNGCYLRTILEALFVQSWQHF